MFSTRLSKLPLAALVAAGLSAAQTPNTPVVQLQNLAHTTETLDKTVPFYRDVLGLPVNGKDPLASQPQKLDEELSKFTGTQGASFRSATFRIPGADFGFELTEFTGTPRKAVMPKLQDVGTGMLVLEVRDMDKVFAKVKASGATIVTEGGVPLNPSGNAASKMREVVVRDPDGFFVELQQPDPLPRSTAKDAGDILGGTIILSIESSAKTVAFLTDALGFKARPTGQKSTNASVTDLLGLPPGAQWRITHGSIPGTAADFALIEYIGVPREKVTAGAQDPGSPAFTLVVSDIKAAVAQWTEAGGTVASTGGKPIVRANGAGNVFVRDANGFMWELIQRAPQ